MIGRGSREAYSGTAGWLVVKKVLRGVPLALLTLAVLAVLLWYGGASTVVAVVARFQRVYLLWFLFLLLAHEVLRGILWHALLGALDDGIPARAQVFAFAAGEAAKILPTGAYLQNYLLQRSSGADGSRSSAATTAMMVGEVVVALVGVAVLGVGAWSTWLRLAIVAGGAAAVLVVRACMAAPRALRTPRSMRQHRILGRALDVVRRARAGLAALAQPRAITLTLVLGALYVFLDGASLYIVVRALDIGGVSLWQAVAVRCFGLAFYLVLGSLEAAGVGALLGMGVSKSAAVSAILVHRALSIGVTSVLAMLVVGILHDQWRAVRGRRQDTRVAHVSSARTADRARDRGRRPAREADPGTGEHGPAVPAWP